MLTLCNEFTENIYMLKADKDTNNDLESLFITSNDVLNELLTNYIEWTS